ncbi:FKBP-type peptidyl-prolyl cis-trans isomerase [Sphingobacterium thermophilum]|uniref:Peptidyl-prolyl cis-trans isomerase n=1 Tax=Sphingobacterium thermophilum TaxID=768534 RepID=A0ABP8R690_9SPHI
MKKLIRFLFVVSLSTAAFTSCNDTDGPDINEIRLRNDQYADSILSVEKPKIEAYVQANLINAVEDTTKYPFEVLNKQVKRGIWYEILSQPTDDSYEYKLNATQTNVVYPTWKLKYSVKLLTSDTPVFSDTEGSTYSLTSNDNNNIFTYAWLVAFFPARYSLNGSFIPYVGLTEKGLKKGSKIKLVVPSIYAYGSTGLSGKVPANSPLVYEFEVLDIQ